MNVLSETLLLQLNYGFFLSTFTAIILKIAYDMDIADLRDEYVLLAQTAVEGVSVATVPGVYWVEHFPILKHIPSWMPGTHSKKMAEYYKPIVETMRNKPFDEIKQAMVRWLLALIIPHLKIILIIQLRGNVSHSMASSMIERLHRKSEQESPNSTDEDLARNVAGVAYAGEFDFVFTYDLSILYFLVPSSCRGYREFHIFTILIIVHRFSRLPLPLNRS